MICFPPILISPILTHNCCLTIFRLSNRCCFTLFYFFPPPPPTQPTEDNAISPLAIPPPKFLTHPQSQIIKQNSKVVLECSTTPADASIAWLYEGRLIRPQNQPSTAVSTSTGVGHHASTAVNAATGVLIQGVLIQGRKLHIHEFRHAKRGGGGDRGDTHEGIYQCLASNEAGVVISQAAMLRRAC